MSPIELITSRLERCIPNGKNRYIACCPAHDDRSPSLSIAEAQDGRVLLHCVAGCPALSIVEAIGCSLSDLFPPEVLTYAPSAKQLIRDRRASETIDHWVLEIAKATRLEG